MQAECTLTSAAHGDQGRAQDFPPQSMDGVSGESPWLWESGECSWQRLGKDALAAHFVSPPMSLILLLPAQC